MLHLSTELRSFCVLPHSSRLKKTLTMYAQQPFPYPGYMPQMHYDPMYPLNVGATPEQPARQPARPAGPQPPLKSTGPPGSMLIPDLEAYAGMPGFPPRLPGMMYGGYQQAMPLGYGSHPMMPGMGMGMHSGHPYYGHAAAYDGVETEPEAPPEPVHHQPERLPSAMKSHPGYGQGVRFSQPERAFPSQSERHATHSRRHLTSSLILSTRPRQLSLSLTSTSLQFVLEHAGNLDGHLTSRVRIRS